MKKRVATILLSLTGLSFAANTPCSGKKGGIDHCEGSQFICVDGSVSASKKICPAGFPVKHGSDEAPATKQKKTKKTKKSNSSAGSAFNPDNY